MWRGIKFDVEWVTATKTQRQPVDSGRVDRLQQWAYALEEFHLKWEWLRSDRSQPSNTLGSWPKNELKTLLGFIRNRAGGFEAFAFPNPHDFRTVDEVISASTPAVGADPANPDSRNYQVVRTFGTNVAPVGVVNEGEVGGRPTAEPAAVVKDDGVSVSFTANSVGTPRDGWIRLATAPAAGSVLTFTGSYLAKVTIKEDRIPVLNTADDFWALKGLTLVTDPG
jgi:hypothetical protein